MNAIVVFSEREFELVRRMRHILHDKGRRHELEAIANNEKALSDLAAAISMYPSILDTQSLRGASRSVGSLVEDLCAKDAIDVKLHIPTKAILGQGFAMAKINFLFMLYYLNRDDDPLGGTSGDLLEMIRGNVFAVMAEEVFMAIISDRRVSDYIRGNAAFMMAKLWERRIDFGVREFSPLLTEIWEARFRQLPSFGTMMGVSELIRLSRDSGPIWTEFLTRNEFDGDEMDSIREFLFGLSFEEMEILASKMEKEEKISLAADDIPEMLGGDMAYPAYTPEDPREFYRSFKYRRRSALLRAGAVKRGPKKTLEEYLMCYLLSRAEWLTL